jgi:excisionase family DNA binding protein
MLHHERIQKTFCTTREAADMLGVSLRTAQLWVESGLLQAWKTSGGHRRISRDSIECLLAKPREEREAPLEAAMPAARLDTEAAAAPFSVLVVEDEAALRRIYEITLARWPMRPQVLTACDGYEALVRIGDVKPDLLITDLRMPGMDGFRMLKALRDMPELDGMAIVVVSGLAPDEILSHGGLPADIAVLPKPIPFDQLREIAERVQAAGAAVTTL